MDLISPTPGDYPIEAWLDDWQHWGPRAPLSQQDVPEVLAYFHRKYAGNPKASEMSAHFWNAQAFFETLLPDLKQAKLIQEDSTGTLLVSYALHSAFYRAVFSMPLVAWPHRINGRLLAQLTKDQKDWNEDRSPG